MLTHDNNGGIMKKLDFIAICKQIAPQYSLEAYFSPHELYFILILSDSKLEQHSQMKIDYDDFLSISNIDIVNQLIKLHKELFEEET